MTPQILPCGCKNQCDDMGHFWRDIRKERQEKKQSNLDESTKLLINLGVAFTSHNNGVHLRTASGHDFWPSTGKWILKSGQKGRGVFKFLKELVNKGEIG